MTVHICQPLFGTVHRRTDTIFTSNTVRASKALGFSTLGIYRYDVSGDSSEKLAGRLDGIIASVEPGDVVIYQYPTWNGPFFDMALLSRIRHIRGVKLVILEYEIGSYMSVNGVKGADEEALRKEVDVLNMADVLILHSPLLHENLLRHGLSAGKVQYMVLSDFEVHGVLPIPMFRRALIFLGVPMRFHFLKNWRYPTKLVTYGEGDPRSAHTNIDYRGFASDFGLLSELTEGGFGLIWADEYHYDYYRMCQPHKVSTYLAAGIPVIVQKGLSIAPFVVNNGLGYEVATIEQVNVLIQSISKKEYTEMVFRIAPIADLIRQCWFTKKMLMDAVLAAVAL